MRLHEYKTLRPLQMYGRMLGTGERLRLTEADAIPLIESGHIRLVDVLVEVNGSDKWVQPVTR